MSKSTQECKDFITSIQSILKISENDIWKRIKKYKKDNFILRDFSNQEGRILTICEDENELTLYSLNEPLNEPINESISLQTEKELGMKYLGKKANESDIAIFLSECIKKDKTIIDSGDVVFGEDKNNWMSCDTSYPMDGINFEKAGNCNLYYHDQEGYTCFLEGKDVSKVHWFCLEPCDTAYRFFVYETKSKHLYLGYNESD